MRSEPAGSDKLIIGKRLRAHTSYTVTITATDTAGARSRTARLSFR
jgi:hypothetical protein